MIYNCFGMAVKDLISLLAKLYPHPSQTLTKSKQQPHRLNPFDRAKVKMESNGGKSQDKKIIESIPGEDSVANRSNFDKYCYELGNEATKPSKIRSVLG